MFYPVYRQTRINADKRQGRKQKREMNGKKEKKRRAKIEKSVKYRIKKLENESISVRNFFSMGNFTPQKNSRGRKMVFFFVLLSSFRQVKIALP